MEHLAQGAVITIRERFHEPLSLDDLARSVMVSKFYFLRVFRRITGVTPGRFLSAVRLHEAKRLLADTRLNVADISAQVCYSSTGTFSRRFTASVGISPTQYRRISRGECAEHPAVLPPVAPQARWAPFPAPPTSRAHHSPRSASVPSTALSCRGGRWPGPCSTAPGPSR
ncbi:HTH-type transcriptional activator RhaR [Streptomyces glaucescens]